MVNVGALALEPRQERGADVERDRGEVVRDVQDTVLRVDPAGGRVGRVALGGDARVPVVIGRGGVLRLDALEPGVLAGRLIEVAVNRDESGVVHERGGPGESAKARRAGRRSDRWLARGLAEGETRAAGHIRWGKMSKGLYGRLGEFTARYTGPHRPRGHRIIVERAAGIPASAYRTASGRALDPERIISNRSHLRREMTNLLRDFAAALHQP